MTVVRSTGTGPVVDRADAPAGTAPDPRRGTRADRPSAPSKDEVGSGAAPAGDPSPQTAAVPRPGREGRRRGGLVLLGLVVPLLLLVVWQAVTAGGLVPSYKFPTPLGVVEAARDLAERGLLLQYAAISTQRVLVGFAIGSAAGLALGAVVGLSRLGDALLAPMLGALRAVPSLAWVPLLLTWLGFLEAPKITLIAIGAFFPVYTTVASALRHVDPHLVEAGRAYGLRGGALLLRVQLPAATPAVVSGLRLAMAQAWLFLVAAELIAASMGLGFLLMDSQNNGRTDRLVLAIVLLAVLGKLTDAVIGAVEKQLLRRW